MIKNTLSVLVLALTSVAVMGQLNLDSYYCGQDLSCRGSPHTLCRAQTKWAPKCQNPEYVIVTDELKQIFIDETNKLRNKQALGQADRIKDPAADMATVQWDDELALGSLFNGLRCEMEHDKCRRTAKYKTAGQNLWEGSNSPHYRDIKQSIPSAVSGWFSEVTDVPNSSEVRQLGSSGARKPIGHWTQLVQSYSHRIGCSIIKYQSGKWKNVLIGCNYSVGNMVGSPIYKIGSPASACKKGKNPKYPGLCHPDEDYTQHESGSKYFDKNAKPSPAVQQWVKGGKKLNL